MLHNCEYRGLSSTICIMILFKNIQSALAYQLLHPRWYYLLAFGAVWGWSMYYHYLLAIMLTGFGVFIIFNAKPWHGFILFSSYVAYCTSWFLGSHPIEIAGVTTGLSMLYTITVWLSASIAIGLAAPIVVSICNRYDIPKNIITISFGWVLLEQISSLNYYVLTYSEQSLALTHYTFAFIGYSQATAPWLSFFASVGGVFMLSFMVVWSGLIFVQLIIQPQEFLDKEKKALWVSGAIILLVCGIHWFVINRQATASLFAAGLRTDTPSISVGGPLTESVKNKEISDELATLFIQNPSIDFVALPEDSRFLYSLQQQDIYLDLHTTIIDSYRTPGPIAYAQAQTYNNRSSFQDGYVKKLLVPGGESLPQVFSFFITIMGQPDVIPVFENLRGYHKGDAVSVSLIDAYKIGINLCSEIHSPWILSQISRQSQILVNIGSHASLHDHPVLDVQMRYMNQVRSAENNRFTVKSNNMASAYIINNYGQIVPSLSESHALAQVELHSSNTLFNRTPYLFLFLSIFSLLMYTNKKKPD